LVIEKGRFLSALFCARLFEPFEGLQGLGINALVLWRAMPQNLADISLSWSNSTPGANLNAAAT